MTESRQRENDPLTSSRKSLFCKQNALEVDILQITAIESTTAFELVESTMCFFNWLGGTLLLLSLRADRQCGDSN